MVRAWRQRGTAFLRLGRIGARKARCSSSSKAGEIGSRASLRVMGLTSAS
jgi:hypothetical protein